MEYFITLKMISMMCVLHHCKEKTANDSYGMFAHKQVLVDLDNFILLHCEWTKKFKTQKSDFHSFFLSWIKFGNGYKKLHVVQRLIPDFVPHFVHLFLAMRAHESYQVTT